MDTKPYIYQFCGFSLDPLKQVLSYQGLVIDLPEKSFQFLEKLILADHQVVEKYHLLDELWKDLVVSEWSLSRLVSDTRHLLAQHVSDQEIIQTLRGKGFKINSNVKIEQIELPTIPVMTKSSSVTSPFKTTPTRKKTTALTITLLCIICFSVLWFYFSKQSKDESIAPSVTTTDLLTVLPVHVQTGDDQDSWVEYGVMTMVIEELQRFPKIKVANMNSTLSNLESVQFQYDPDTIFAQVCPALGCKQLLLMNLNLSQDKRPSLSYQLIYRDNKGTNFSFISEDILEASNMLLEHLLQMLMPQSPERLMLSHTYTNNHMANQDYAIGVSRVYHGEFQSAKDYLDLAIKREPSFTWAKIYQIEILYREGKLKQAEHGIQELMQQALDIRQTIFLQNVLSNIAYSQGNLEQSIDIANGFLEAVEQTQDKDLFGSTHMNIGTSYQAIGDISKALGHLQIALDTFQQHGFKLREAQALLNLGNTIWVGNTDYELASHYYQKSADIFRQLGARNYLVYAKHMSAGIKISSKRYAIAKRELNEVVTLYQELGDTEGELIAQADLVLAALKEQNLAEAEKIGLAVYQRSVEQFTYPRSIVSAYIAITYLNLQQFSKAKIYIDERNKYDWFDPRPAFAMIPASYAHATGDFQQAVNMAEKLKIRLGKQWNAGHQTYINAFQKDLNLGTSSIKDYANLYTKEN
ncbi:winged helix-turn-helix domain-containing protein [uncultured Paraglaciecola sp.]|uniref:winged helix-turn-helix domain-containing protein n=1 Tax=uncultured Paraglaciecola sp. TaxID=1765024 RepID=UPI0030DD6FC4|tara:strand:- start:29370 stop:31451 length:2082 start_codon:yes stop_codon:yes gene_type:complete